MKEREKKKLYIFPLKKIGKRKKLSQIAPEVTPTKSWFNGWVDGVFGRGGGVWSGGWGGWKESLKLWGLFFSGEINRVWDDFREMHIFGADAGRSCPAAATRD